MGFFYLLVIVYNAAMNMGIEVSLGDLAFNPSRFIHRSGIAGLYATSMFLIFWGTAIFFLYWLHHFLFPPILCGFLHILTHTLFSVFFSYSNHPDGCEVVSHCGFVFIFYKWDSIKCRTELIGFSEDSNQKIYPPSYIFYVVTDAHIYSWNTRGHWTFISVFLLYTWCI